MESSSEDNEEKRVMDIENTIFVAVGKNVKGGGSRSTLDWAVKSFGGNKICLVHVHQPTNMVSFGTCSLDFSRFPYEAHGECLDGSVPDLTMQTCCRAALQSLFQAMCIRANQSGSIFIDPVQAQDCSTSFQNLHNRTSLSRCNLPDFISVSNPNACTSGVDSVMNVVGNEKYSDLQSNCGDLSSTGNSSDDACFNCVVSYRQTLQALRGGETAGKGCSEALLVSLASSNLNSLIWVHGIFSCLFDEIDFPLPTQNRKSGYLMGSKKLLIVVVMAASLVIITPILYKITRKRLQDASEKDIEIIVLKKTLEEESRSLFTSDLYIFSQDEVAKATNSFDESNLIGERTSGKIYIGIMPSGMRVAIKRINDGVNLHDFMDEICRKTKIRHPNLVGIMGYCDRGDQCLVYEYCVNGNLAQWLIGQLGIRILTWEQRLQISIGIARGLWYLHYNPLEKTVHGNVKLTNILLNEKLEAKLLGSVLSKRKPKKKNMLESMAMTNDVFGLGFVLLQILTGRKAKSLVDEAREAVLKGGSTSSLADPQLNGAYVSTEFCDILSIAVLCTTQNECQRPNMVQVLRKLEEFEILV